MRFLLGRGGFPDSLQKLAFRAKIDNSDIGRLFAAIQNRDSPTSVWNNYTSVTSDPSVVVPFDLHRLVLRTCSPQTSAMRLQAIHDMHAGTLKCEHPQEGRFRHIIRNMLATPEAHPDLDDFHYILEQFAVVGNFLGSHDILEEMKKAKITPDKRTYTLCLQAITTRLTQPSSDADKLQCQKVLVSVLSGPTHFTSVLLDMSLRIFKDTDDFDTFKSLLKWGYGFDLHNPDRQPIELLNVPEGGIRINGILPLVPHVMPFSTSTLNTTIDAVGTHGTISELVQTFEVLTTALPNAQRHLEHSFDNEDEEWGENTSPDQVSATTPLACASPNTTSYIKLLRYVCQMGHTTLARHYLVQAGKLHTEVAQQTRKQIYSMQFTEVIPPSFTFSWEMVQSVSGVANRNKNIPMLLWLCVIIRRFLQKKHKDLIWYTDLKRGMIRRQIHPWGPIKYNQAILPTSTKTPTLSSTLTSQTPTRVFRLNDHINVLTRDIQKLQTLLDRIIFLRGRLIARTKERLGRRVWNTKDIFLHTLEETYKPERRVVTRSWWNLNVNFKTEEEIKK